MKLTKALVTQRDVLVGEMRKAHDELTAATNSYNEALSGIRTFAEEVITDSRSKFEAATEKWQEGEKGQEADEWIQQWENADIPDDLEEPDETFFTTIEEIE